MNPTRVGFDPGVVMLFSISNFSLHSLYCSKACNELTGPISASMHQRTTKLLSKRYRSGGEPLATLCSIWRARRPWFEPQTFWFRDECVTDWPTGGIFLISPLQLFQIKICPPFQRFFFLSFSTGSGASRIVTGGRSQPNRDRNNLGGASSN